MQRSASGRGAPPGPDGIPLLGNTREYVQDPLAFFEDLAREYGPVAAYEIGGEQFVQVSDPELVRRVLVDDNDAFVKGEQFMETLKPVLGDGLLTSEGELWRSQRHTVEPSFYPEMLASYATEMTDATERALADWTPGEQRDIHEDMMSLTVEIAAQALFDVDIRAQEEAIGEALETVMDRASSSIRRPVDVPRWVPTPGNRRFNAALDDLHAVAERIIEKHERAGGDASDVVSLLLASDDDLPRERIRDEVITILLAGHETTALALTYALHLLSENPGTRDRLQAELDDVLGGRPPTVEDLDDLPYTERVIEETMRVYPPVYDLLREATEDIEMAGYRIPEGRTVTFQQWVLHRDPRFYDDPEQFRPERWTDEFREDLPAFAYFPFGGGPRRCIGDRFAMLEARLVLATICQEWTVESAVANLGFRPSITLRPDGPVEMVPERR
ncbi:Cytochrome P450 [Natronoarchaeum philippinense]|uniref:Cytochrome P450 n=1 Tax=Natronoarchaeum philippinense TaxID=558529 RepID=A0A285P0I1_NATPI|nr:cytochrome P450 [Natronoarchaeum philippinense]SNZ14958.1 Cytochrome P450 [Natronoarchaeum philippinense]